MPPSLFVRGFKRVEPSFSLLELFELGRVVRTDAALGALYSWNEKSFFYLLWTTFPSLFVYLVEK